jgi:arsenite methyltransferase
MKETEIRQSVRENYGKIAKESGSCCTPKGKKSSCCNTTNASSARDFSKSMGYSDEDLDNIPEGANLGLGCGNPLAIAALKEGETVLDLGSGAGFDCFLAANRVGAKGKVIGVDMTAEMLDKARENARKNNYANVEFRLGEIEALPVADNSVDVIISNCVINLSTDKPRVFREAYRVLKPGGRLMVSDIVLTKQLPKEIQESVEAYVSCIGGAILEEDYLGAVEAAGFKDVRVADETGMVTDSLENDPTARAIAESAGLKTEQAKELTSAILSIKVAAVKPG